MRDTWDSLEKSSLAEEASALVVDDQRRAYDGEDYEEILVRVFLTLASLMGDGVDAESYSLQTLAQHQKIVEREQADVGEAVTADYCIPAIAPYLRGVVREATLHDYDDAFRAYQLAEQLLPGSPQIAADIQRVTHGVHSAPEHGVVYVIAMVGRGPYKVETEAVATKEALLIADQILSSLGEYSLPPTLAPVKIPSIVSPRMPFDLVGIQVDGNAWTTTLPMTDLQELAQRTAEIHQPKVLARAVARRIVKKGAVYSAKDHFNADSALTSLAFDAAGVLWEATESADTRCWGLLPRQIQCARLELPAGSHQLHLEPVAGGSPLSSGVTELVNVSKGRNTYVLSYWADRAPIGQVLVSQPQ
ncbi:MAG: hypothetical protein KDB22_20595 [Planctomycetales bacterium]|nr:hypothetical protein [Planctomycetales bacterium]